MLSWLILVAGVANAQDCQPTSSEQLSSIMQQALIDFATLDEDSFFESTQQAEDALPCLDELFLAPNAAAYHRLQGLRAFFNGDDDATTLAFRAALSIEPDYQLSSKLAPEGGKLSRLWDAAKNGPNPFIGSFTAPAGKYAYVDGEETRTYAEDLPNIVQYGPGDGSILWTGYVGANEKPPAEIPAAGAISLLGAADDADLDDLDDLDADLDALVDDDPYAGLDDDDSFDDSRGGSDSGYSRESSFDDSRGRESTRDSGFEDSRGRDRSDLKDAPKPEQKKGKGGLIAATAISAVAAGGMYGSATYFRNEYNRYPTRQSYLMTNGSYFGAIGAGVLTLTFGSLAIFTEEGPVYQPMIRF